MHPRPLLYTRELPGGGFVAIDVVAAGERHHARLLVERRGDSLRRSGHHPPIIAEADAPDLEAALAPLRQIAVDNVALALAIRQWQANRGRELA